MPTKGLGFDILRQQEKEKKGKTFMDYAPGHVGDDNYVITQPTIIPNTNTNTTKANKSGKTNTATIVKESKREPFSWTDDDFLEGWNSVYNTEPEKSTVDDLRQTRERLQNITRGNNLNFGGSYQWAKKSPGVLPKTQIGTKGKEWDDRLFLEGFYEVDGARTDWEREARMEQVDEALKEINQRTSPQKVNYSLAQNNLSQEENPDLKEFGENSSTYKILQDLGNRWMNGTEQEREELHAVAEEIRRLARGGNTIKDVNAEVMELLHNNAEEAKAYQKWMTDGVSGFLYDMGSGNATLDSALFLIGMTNHGPWDYKWDDDWRVPGETFDGKDLDKHNHRNWLPWMYFDGKLLSADKLGNMNMAYVGKKMGLPEWVYKNLATTDKDDAYWVQYGIDLANSGR